MNSLMMTTRRLACALTGLSMLISAAPGLAGDEHAVLPPLTKIATIASTVPGNGDVNPYGMAQIKRTVGKLQAGHILISNFNNSGNIQGTGTTIVDVAPDGAFSVFAEIDASSLPGSCPGGVATSPRFSASRKFPILALSMRYSSRDVGRLAAGGPGCEKSAAAIVCKAALRLPA